jgi:hypothetical protein
MATAFKVIESVVEGVNVVEISGLINEFAEFPNVKISPIVRVSLKGVTGLNSVGTRNWCNWIGSIQSPSTIVLTDCPVIFVRAFNQVEGALPANASVFSFLVPYISEITDEYKDILFIKGNEFTEEKGVRPPNIDDSKGNRMDMDVVFGSYFEFLKIK